MKAGLEGGGLRQVFMFIGQFNKGPPRIGGLDKVRHCLWKHAAPLLPGNSYCDSREEEFGGHQCVDKAQIHETPTYPVMRASVKI